MAGSNTLRPYYDHDTFDAGYSVIFKPGVGLIDTETNKPITSSLASSIAKQSSQRNFKSGQNIGLSGLSSKKSIGDIGIGKTTASNGTDKNYIYDLEFQEYFDFNNLSELLKNLVWNFCKNYFKVLLSQPLEIVRLVLQVGTFDFSDSPPKRPSRYSRLLNKLNTKSSDTPQLTDISDESDGEVNYFESPSPSMNLPKEKSRTKSPSKIRKLRYDRKTKNKNKIQPVSLHTVDIMSSIIAKDGPFALFRGINASFIHQTLSHTIEAWITGFISPFLGIPDPFFLDLTHLTEPLKSLWLSVLACVLTGLILMPLDLIKVRLMITQFNKPSSNEESGVSSTDSLVTNIKEEKVPETSSRSIRDSICNFPIHFLVHPPPTISFLTVLHQFSTSIFRKAAPYILFIRFNIDSYLSPNLYTFVNLFLLILEFFIKLPVENLLRKEQVRFLLRPKSVLEDEKKVITIDSEENDLIIDFNNGWKDDIDNEVEDSDGELKPLRSVSLWQRVKILGLFNGWRVGVLNVIGFWGYNILKKNGTELKEERL
ncbi:uncharacterized protein AC631_00140 [Debaryomyces fabryi]|uniref:Mitochondrial fusion and transport protein UGO1 n=1 Tax=Debaryomyces fabryi TaxID=58627 RepID=A0A0V1Q6J0_9ASCO|nr:uncharacterized protein AC631_00140 [Debaryomyces fabryi]KSA04061.1 hypothetical protein AC631_00140 [Debaryomyces fabryi]CUM50235.1 unnamed protein product [Debaryomyces fabryi]